MTLIWIICVVFIILLALLIYIIYMNKTNKFDERASVDDGDNEFAQFEDIIKRIKKLTSGVENT